MNIWLRHGISAAVMLTALACKPQPGPSVYEGGATPTTECAGHFDCASGVACVDGSCRGSLDEPMRVTIDASPFFVYASGSCAWDGECGPWICRMGSCTDPQEAGIAANYPPRRAFTYWDMSCNVNDDCGGWACAGGFCVDPARLPEGYIDPISGLPGQGDGRTCLSDGDCYGDECVSPGFCHPNRGWEPMVFAELDVNTYAGISSGYCSSNDDCGPWICDYGTCLPPERTIYGAPRRDELKYYDGSCGSSLDCGSWSCVNSWCRPSGVLGTSGSGGGTGGGTYNGTACLSDSECGYDGECLSPGECWSGRGNELMTWADIAVDSWFTFTDGSCYTDSDCGPWVCWSGYCTAPEYTTLYRPARSEIEYYDGSCGNDSECGSWVCDGTWCRASGAGTGGLGMYGGGLGGGGTGATCASHSSCGYDEACVPPGVCEYGRLYETWNPDDMNIRHYVASGYCSRDSECGPWLCDYGACVSPFSLGIIPPQRWEVTYYDGSCFTDAECGPWYCYDGWCRDSSRYGR